MSRQYLSTERNRRLINATHSEERTILFDCSHITYEKENRKPGSVCYHHPDYNKPFEVHRLCRKCHSTLHRDSKANRRSEEQKSISALVEQLAELVKILKVLD